MVHPQPVSNFGSFFGLLRRSSSWWWIDQLNYACQLNNTMKRMNQVMEWRHTRKEENSRRNNTIIRWVSHACIPDEKERHLHFFWSLFRDSLILSISFQGSRRVLHAVVCISTPFSNQTNKRWQTMPQRRNQKQTTRFNSFDKEWSCQKSVQVSCTARVLDNDLFKSGTLFVGDKRPLKWPFVNITFSFLFKWNILQFSL